MQKRTWNWQKNLVAALAVVCISAPALAAGKVNPTGTWKWDRERNGQKIPHTLKLTLKKDVLSGTFKLADRDVIKFDSGKLDGDKATFQITLEFNDRKFIAKFNGKVSDETIKGKIDLESEGESREFDWEAKRAVDKADVVGKWQIRVETDSGQVFEPVLKLKNDAGMLKGTYSSERLGEREVTEIKIDGSKLTFKVVIKNDDSELILNYSCKPRGNSMTGTVKYKIGDNSGTLDFESKRIVEKKKKKKDGDKKKKAAEKKTDKKEKEKS